MRTKSHVSRPAPLILILGFLGFVLLLVALFFYPRGERRFWQIVRGDELRLLRHDSSGWRQIELPGIPYDIQVSSGGDVWVETMLPKGLSRWSGGQWTHYDGPDGPSAGFAVSGKQIWVATDRGGLQRFDGQNWRALPVLLQEPMAMAAEGNEVWVINSGGVLAHCDSDTCDRHLVTRQIPDNAWDSQILGGRKRRDAGWHRLGYGSLLRTHGRLWFIHNSAWYSSDGQEWTEWKGNRDTLRPLGSSGDRIWVRTQDAVMAIGEDLRATAFARGALGGGSIYNVNAGDGHVMVAAGGRGFYERIGGSWQPVAVDATLHSEDVRRVVSTPDGAVWIITSSLPDLRRVCAFGGLILAMLLIWNLRARSRKRQEESLLST